MPCRWVCRRGRYWRTGLLSKIWFFVARDLYKNVCFMRAPSNRTLVADAKRVFESVSIAPCDLFFVV